MLKYVLLGTGLALAIPSIQGPNGIPALDLPQFVVLGSDDNFGTGMGYMVDLLDTLKNPQGRGSTRTFDGAKVSMTFYSNGTYSSDKFFVENHQKANAKGFEIANHTYQHLDMVSTRYPSLVDDIVKNVTAFETPQQIQVYNYRYIWKLDTLKFPYWISTPGSSWYADSLRFIKSSATTVKVYKGQTSFYSVHKDSLLITFDFRLSQKYDTLDLKKITRDTSILGYDTLGRKIALKHLGDSVAVAYSKYNLVANRALTDTFSVLGNNMIQYPAIKLSGGFRAPYLSIGDTLVHVLDSLGYLYDCSLQDGWEKHYSPSKMAWPYLLGDGNPEQKIVAKAPKLWEIPAAPYWLVPDSLASKYGVAPGMLSRGDSASITTGRITGLDYNLYFEAKLDSNDVLAIYKYNLDQRLAGNRAPLALGIHGQYYGKNYNAQIGFGMYRPGSDWALRNFVNYALSKPEVRLVSGRSLVEWMNAPMGLSGTTKVEPVQNRSMSYAGGWLDGHGADLGFVKVFAMDGRLLVDQQISSGQSRFQLNLPRGVYWVQSGMAMIRVIQP